MTPQVASPDARELVAVCCALLPFAVLGAVWVLRFIYDTSGQFIRHLVGLSRDGSAVAGEQPAPVPNRLPAVWDLVIGDMRARDRLGRERYGVPLQPDNGRDNLLDLYQELLDSAVYCRSELFKRDGR